MDSLAFWIVADPRRASELVEVKTASNAGASFDSLEEVDLIIHGATLSAVAAIARYSDSLSRCSGPSKSASQSYEKK